MSIFSRNQKVGDVSSAVAESPVPARTGTMLVLALLISVLCGVAYYFSSPNHHSAFNYTQQIGSALLQGDTGLAQLPDPWLNEFIPFNDHYYSAFPLGSVLTVLPTAILKDAGIIQDFPSAMLAALIAFGCALLSFGMMYHFTRNPVTTVFAVIALLFGTWFWTNIAFGGAWQLALGFAVLGELGALYFILNRPCPLLAGFFFAMAFGNRTELILTAPVFMYLLIRHGEEKHPLFSSRNFSRLAQFCVVPFLLGVATLAYNFARFGSPLDFGYARIPGVLEEPWYKNGIFSFSEIKQNATEMLIRKWRINETFPYLVPTGFGGSIFLSSPFLLLLIFRRPKFLDITLASWVAVFVITATLFMHGNPGGWQYSYRYAVVLLPWLWLLWAISKRESISYLMGVLIVASVGINTYATWLFHWTNYVQP